jgi:putative hemolysin
MSYANSGNPQWGRESGIAPWLVRLFARLSGIDALHSIYKSIGPTQGPVEFASRALSTMRIDVSSCEEALKRIPEQGRVIIVANHPFGALDGLAAIRILGARRPDMRVLANADLSSIDELAPMFLPLNTYGRGSTSRNAQSLRKAWRWLEEEHALVIFPAGEVAHFDARARCVTDPPWSPIIGRLVQKTAAPVVPLFFAGQNSALFQIAGMLAPQLRTLLLPGELRRRMRSSVHAHLGEPIANERIREFKSPEALALHLRLKTFLAPVNEPRRDATLPTHARSNPSPLKCRSTAWPKKSHGCPPRRDCWRMAAWKYCWRARTDSAHAGEIGRLREVTFRGVGEGTGRARDLDRFDAYYEHLFIWHTANRQIVGAYRLAAATRSCAATASRGSTHHVVQLSRSLLHVAGPGARARAFIRARRIPAQLRAADAAVEGHRRIRGAQSAVCAAHRAGQRQRRLRRDLQAPAGGFPARPAFRPPARRAGERAQSIPAFTRHALMASELAMLRRWNRWPRWSKTSSPMARACPSCCGST